jgi:hypothetical protein
MCINLLWHSFRLAICDDFVLSQAFQTAEDLLFRYRLSCLQENELYRAVTPLRKLQAFSSQALSDLSDIKAICTALNMLTTAYFRRYKIR